MSVPKNLKNEMNLGNSQTQNSDKPIHLIKPAELFSGVEFPDKRHQKAAIKIVEKKCHNPSGSLYQIMGSRGSAKAAYRYLNNPSIDFESVQEQTINAIKNSIHGLNEILLVQDTCYINLAGHIKTKDLGLNCAKSKGLILHSTCAVGLDGVPIGILHQSCKTRSVNEDGLFPIDKALLPIETKESYRWIEAMKYALLGLPDSIRAITVADREGDIYEVFSEALKLNHDFVIRISQNRKTEDRDKVMDKVLNSKVIGKMVVNVPHNSRKGTPTRQTELEIRACQAVVKQPKNSSNNKVPQTIAMNFVALTELTALESNKPSQWIIGTTLPITSVSDITKIAEIYSQRWKIETMHYTLKSGLKVEEIQLRSFESMKPLVFMFSIIAIYLMVLTYMSRTNPELSCEFFFDDLEWKILHRYEHSSSQFPHKPYTIGEGVLWLSNLGGGKRAPSDGPPGVKTIWKGYFKLQIIIEAYQKMTIDKPSTGAV